MGRVVKDSSVYGIDGIVGIGPLLAPLSTFDTTVGVGGISLKTTIAASPGSGAPCRFSPEFSSDPLRTLQTQFTFEGYVQWAATPSADEAVFSHGSNLRLLRKSTNAFAVITPSGATITSGTGSYTNGTLMHWALTRNVSNVITLWLNGVSAGTTSDSTSSGQGDVYIGSFQTASFGSQYNSAFRFTNGVCRYTAGFSPSGSAWPTSVAGDASWLSVVLLMNGDERTTVPATEGDDTGDVPAPGVFATTVPLAFTVPDPDTNDTAWDAYDQGTYKVRGTTKTLATPSNIPISRFVALQEAKTRRVIRGQWSDPVTGAYSFDYLKYDPVADSPHYDTVTYDYLHGYRAVIADNLTPEAM